MEAELGVVAGIVLGLCQILKTAGLPSRWVPLSGVAIGVLSSFVIADVSVVQGLVGSLTAMGLFSGGKATLQ